MTYTDFGRRPRGRRHHREHGPHRFGALFPHGRGGRSVRRGAVRAAILTTLRDQPMHGYQLITELETRTNGRWRPSAGSIYPNLQLLEDEGLLASEVVEGRKTYHLTDAGHEAADASPAVLAGRDNADGPSLRRLGVSLVQAAAQVDRAGSPEAITAAREVLVESRRRLYALLAEDGGDLPDRGAAAPKA